MHRASERAIPMVDLRAQYESIKAEVDAAICRVIESSAFIHGKYSEAFERDFASYCGVAHAVGVGNGTDALILALRALGVGPGDEVITTPFTFTATAEAIVECGAEVRFVDVDPATRNMDPAQIASALTPRTRVILPVHLYGLPADMGAIRDIARDRGVAVLEDAAQAVGASIANRRVGSFGDAACFSFYPGKNLGAYGDGGAVVTDDQALAQKVRMLGDHGRISKYEHGIVGVNSRLDGIQGAVLGVKLGYLERWNLRRAEIARRYSTALQDVAGVRTPRVPANMFAVFHLYVIEAERRDELCAYLNEHGIAAAIHYPLPLHLQPAYAFMGLGPGAFPVAEALARSVLSLPIYPELGDADVDRIAGLIWEFYTGRAF